MHQLLQPCNPERRGRTEMLIQVSRARSSSDLMSEAPKQPSRCMGSCMSMMQSSGSMSAYSQEAYCAAAIMLLKGCGCVGLFRHCQMWHGGCWPPGSEASAAHKMGGFLPPAARYMQQIRHSSCSRSIVCWNLVARQGMSRPLCLLWRLHQLS